MATVTSSSSQDLSSDDDDDGVVMPPPTKTMRMDTEIPQPAKDKYVKLVPGGQEDSVVKESIEVPRRIAAMNTLIAEMLEDADEEEEEDAPVPEIPLPNITASCLRAAIEFCMHHLDDPMALIPKPMELGKNYKDYVSTWDYNFAEAMDDVTLFAMIKAADYLTNTQLLMLTTARLATIIKTIDNVKMKERFNVQTDPTAEDRARIVAMYKWVTDEEA